MLLRWRYSSPIRIQAIKNLASFSLNLRRQPMWYLRSPPMRRSITRYKFYLSWKAYAMLTMKGCFSLESSSLSLRTEWMLFFPIILVLCISFMAYIRWVFLSFTLHTLPNPPFPITYWQSKCYRLTYLLVSLILFYSSCLDLNLLRSILKQFFISLLDFLLIVELLLLCSFSFLTCVSLECSYLWWSAWLRPLCTPMLLCILYFLPYFCNTLSDGLTAGQVFLYCQLWVLNPDDCAALETL